MTTSSKELSEQLATMYEVDASIWIPTIGNRSRLVYLAEDSGRISDLADENELNTDWFKNWVNIYNVKHLELAVDAVYADYPTKSAAARMARVRCLIAIGEGK